MNYKNLFMLFTVGLVSTFLLADNPGDEVVTEDAVVEKVDESVEEVVNEEDVSSSDEAVEGKMVPLF
jgi:hypothetical protein